MLELDQSVPPFSYAFLNGSSKDGIICPCKLYVTPTHQRARNTFCLSHFIWAFLLKKYLGTSTRASTKHLSSLFREVASPELPFSEFYRYQITDYLNNQFSANNFFPVSFAQIYILECNQCIESLPEQECIQYSPKVTQLLLPPPSYTKSIRQQFIITLQLA